MFGTWGGRAGARVTRARLPRRTDCAPSSLPGLVPLDPAKAPAAFAVATLPEAALTAPVAPGITGPEPRAVSPVLAVAVPPGPMVAVTTTAPASPAVSMAAALGTVTRDR